MEHKLGTELEAELIASTDKIHVGGIYVHYKDPIKRYVVDKLVIWEPNDEVAVLYTQVGLQKIPFVRELREWLKPAEVDGKEVERFREVI